MNGSVYYYMVATNRMYLVVAVVQTTYHVHIVYYLIKCVPSQWL